VSIQDGTIMAYGEGWQLRLQASGAYVVRIGQDPSAVEAPASARHHLAALLVHSGLSQAEFAERHLARDGRSLRRWLRGGPVPATVRRWLRHHHPVAVNLDAISRLTGGEPRGPADLRPRLHVSHQQGLGQTGVHDGPARPPGSLGSRSGR
jgi:phosphatidylserine/phosphatidylglycerophosphate/cardiolipin synthase-like enzyme